LPDLGKWPEDDYKYFATFYGCLSLSFIPNKQLYPRFSHQYFDTVNCINGENDKEI